VDILVRPILEPGAGGNLALVVFQGRPRKETPQADAKPVELPEQEKDARIHELEHDLQAAKEYLQTTVEELETSNEELKSSIEELQSTNEELQSTNEELDTSREELQSTNEELRTINSEHQQRIEELSGSFDDLNNLLTATEMASLFLDEDLRIRRFTPAARKLFRLMDRDVGRPLQDITSSLRYENLAADIRSVTQTFSRIDKEIQDDSGAWYRMKVVPYRTSTNRIDGSVVTFIDIDLEKSTGFAQAIVETVREPLLILDGGLHVIAANPAFYRQFQVEPRDTLGRNIWDLGGHQWDIPELRELLERIVPQNTKFEDYIVTHSFPRIGTRTIALNARQIVFQGEATGRVLLAMEDITDREQGR
jgi:two-component system, chemotaxis family, CheB/CheR fusion protein